jgi:hypothetical protein
MKRTAFSFIIAITLLLFCQPCANAFNLGWVDDVLEVILKNSDEALETAGKVGKKAARGLKSSADDFAAKLPDFEKVIIKKYTDEAAGSLLNSKYMPFYKQINQFLRGSLKEVHPNVVHFISRLDDILARASIPKPVKVFRGSAIPPEIYNKLQFDAFGKIDISALKGMRFTERGFMSTSRHQGTASMFAMKELFTSNPNNKVKAILREINVPKGARGADISKISEYAEHEILFARNQTTVIKKAFLDAQGILHTVEEMVLDVLN